MKGARGALLALLIGGFLAEVVVRFMGTDRFGDLVLLPYDVLEPIESGMRVNPDTSYLVFDEGLGWTIGTNRQGHNGLYHSNAAGERVSGLDASGGETWATAFGDSFTHGDDVADDETWLSRLSHAGLGTVNAAVPGYGVDQAWLRYRQLRNRVSTRAILIGVMADNIGRHVNRYRPFITPSERIFFVKPRFEKDGSDLRLLPSPFQKRSDYEVEGNRLRAQLFEVGSKDRFFDPGLYEASPLDHSRLLRIAHTLVRTRTHGIDWRSLYADPEAVDLTVDIVKGFVDDVLRDQRHPVLVFLPDRSVAEDVALGRTPPTAGLVARLKALGCPLIDLTEPVARFVLKGNAGEAFLPHYSPALSQAVADYIVMWKKGEKSLS